MNYDPRKAIRQAMMIARREVTAPNKASIKGQRHILAYITPYEAELLMRRGGSGRLTEYGVPAFDDGDGDGEGGGPGGDNDNSTNDTDNAADTPGAFDTPDTPDAPDQEEEQQQTAPPSLGPPGNLSALSTPDPGPPSGPHSGFGSAMSQDPEGTPAAANMNTAVSAQQQGYGVGIADTGGVAPTGFGAAPGIAEAFDAYDKGIIGLNQALGYAALSAFSPPGLEFGQVTDEVGNQSVGGRGNIGGAIGGIAGIASGVPGAGTVGGMIGSQVADALGVPSQTFSFADGGAATGRMDPRDDITSNENFNAWFGNSVAHDNGVPIRFYHGTSKDKDFTSFNMGKHGVWLTTDPEEASAYAEQNDSQGYSYASGKIEPTNVASRVIPVYLKAENPYTGDLPEQFKSDNYKKAQSIFFDQLRAAGYDSWIPEKQNGNIAVALKHPTQIKSAVGNNGNFSPEEKHIARADGGEIMPQRDLGADPTVQRAMDVTAPFSVSNPMSVFPKPQRMWEDQRPGGAYLAMPTKEDITGHKAAQAEIGVNPGGKPFFNVSRDAVEETGSPGRGSATVKTNLFKQKAGWQWAQAPEGHENTNTLVSINHRGKHHYALNAQFPKGVDLARYENAPSEPRLRPTTKGNVELGEQVGTIMVRGKEHPVYRNAIVRNAGGAVGYADGGMPGDDPMVQQALDITRQAQPTAPQMARQLNEQGMYSHAAEVAAGLPQAKGSPQQMLAMLSSRGVKPDEIKHSGVEDAFGNQKVVTKDQLAQHFNENMPQIEKVVLGGKQPFDEQRLAQLEKEYSTLDEHPIDAPSFGEDKYNDMIRLMNIRDQSSTQSLYDAAERAMQQAQRAQSRGDRNTAERYFREHELLNTRAEKLDLEGQGLSRPTKYKSFTLPGGENYREVLFKAKERNADQLEAAQNKRYELRLLYDDAMENYKKISESNPGHPNAVAAYQKVNETRSALKNAEKELSDLQSEAANRTYESSHWDEPNVLAHVRLLDRKAPNGEKVLHVEEIQSDWAQEGRRAGFKDVDALKKYQKKNFELMAQFQEAHKAHKELTDRLAPPVNERFRPGEESPREYENRIDALEAERQNSLAEHPEWKASAKRLQDIRNAHKALGEQMPPDTGVPAGPYVTNTQAWTDLALKAALKEAVEGNYDRIAWTGGQDQAERYDLSKHIDSVHYNPGTQTLYAMNKNGREVLNEDAEPHEIQKHIGKELADKLLADVPDLHSVINEHEIEKDPETGKWGIFLYGDPIHDYGGDLLEFDSKGDAKDHLREMAKESLNNHTSTLRNVDLVVGGEGMKSYYDKIVPTRITEVTKKLGVPTKVEPHKIDTEEGEKTLHSIKVTPELKTAVMRGMPAYNTGGTVGYANGGIAFDDPVIQQALRITAKKRPMVALADLFQRQLRGRPPS